MGIDRSGQGLLEHTETIEHIGETKCWVGNLEQAWKRETETARNLVQRTGAYIFIERDFAASKQAVWDLVTSPQHHARWQRADGVVENNAQGVVAPARRTIACMARTRSSRTSLTGAR